MKYSSEFVRGAFSFSAVSVYGTLVVFALCWGLLAWWYDEDNLRAAGRSVVLTPYDKYGHASAKAARLQDVPGNGPLILYVGASMAGAAVFKPSFLHQQLTTELGELDSRAIWAGGLSIWEIEAIAQNLDPSRERIVLLPMGIARFQLGQDSLKNIADSERLLIADKSYWKKILNEEEISAPVNTNIMLFDNYPYFAKRSTGVVQQILGYPKIQPGGWRPKIQANAMGELKKMWADSDYIPDEDESRARRAKNNGGLSTADIRGLAHYSGLVKLDEYSQFADEAEEMLIRVIQRLMQDGSQVIMFETPFDVESMTRFEGAQATQAFIKDMHERLARISELTGAPIIYTGTRADLPTTTFSDWIHVVDHEAAKSFTRLLAKDVAKWYDESKTMGRR